MGLDPPADPINQILYFCLGDSVCAEVADEGIVSEVLFEGLIEFVLESDVSLEQTFESLLAERQGFGLVGVEIGAHLLEDGLHD